LNAETRINALARKHWEIPIRIDTTLASTPANTPPFVQSLCTQLSIVNLFKRRPGTFTDLPEMVKAMKSDVKDLLKMVNHGDIDLGINPAPQRSTLVIATATSSDREYTADTLKDF